jgi:hypothetical protein
MPTSPTPNWSAARAGTLGDTGAVNHAAQINQFLGTHASNAIYPGNAILTPSGTGGTDWLYHLDAYDVDQPFTMSGTTIGRVTIPLLPVGNGADLIVSLYSNNAGVPGTVVTRTRIPAAWITQLAAVYGLSGPASTLPMTEYTNSPLAVAQFNSLHMGAPVFTNLPNPASAAAGPALFPTVTSYGNYFILLGGQNSGATAFYNTVFTMQYDAAGNVSAPIPQAALPATIGTSGAAVVSADPTSGDLTLVLSGGIQTPGGSTTSTVFTASFNSSTGAVGAWSVQAALPVALENHAMAAYNGFVYSVGGITTPPTTTNAVYYAQVQNGQVTAWSTASPLPTTLAQASVIALDGFLFAISGNVSAGVPTSAVWYAPIHADGSIGSWQAGPSLPGPVTNNTNGAGAANTHGIVVPNPGGMYLLGATNYGPDVSWATGNNFNNGLFYAITEANAGQFWTYALQGGASGTQSVAALVSLTPRISVPLPTTGLTNGATYHVVLSQANGDLNNYLRTSDDFDAFPGNPTLLTRAIGSSTWVTGTTGHAVPITVYDQTINFGNQAWHTWEDGSARVSTLVYATTPDRRLLGILDATTQPGPILNMNPTFTVGFAPWTAFNGTAAQSNAFTHGGLPFSAQVTPGGVTFAYIESEKESILQGHTYVGTCWLYSAVGYSNAGINLNWYTSSGTYVSTTAGAGTALPAGVWTQVTVSGSPPATAATGTILPIENGTPPITAIFYVSAATLQDANGPMVSSVANLTYPGTWPGTVWPPLGVTQLA